MRTLLGTGITVLLACLAYFLESSWHPELTAARRISGERWFQLFYDDRQVGYMHTAAHRDGQRQWHFTSLTHFMVADGYPVSISEHLTFSSRAPYLLERAEHWNQRRGSAPEGTLIEQTAEGMQATFVHDATSRERPIAWRFALAEHLAFEIWLDQATPAAGEETAVRAPDFDRGTLVTRMFAITELNSLGYQVRNPALLSPTVIQLDHNYAPVAMSMAGLFTARRSSRQAALASRSPLHLTDYSIPLDQQLVDHHQIAELDLAIATKEDLSEIWPDARREARGWSMKLTANSLSEETDPSQATSETLSYPTRHPAVLTLLEKANLPEEPVESIAELVQFVHSFITYTPGTKPRSVLETIDKRSGECTEFADLLTTLARASGISAKTVVGLAYANDTPPGFAFHAWNEIAIEDTWHAVDPTWNQLQVDATHIPLPANEVALLRLLQGGEKIRFSVDSVRYFSRSGD
ncbi:MAG: transglutaminase-like domain-containing protein [Pseudomonadales bacterium]|nr:transglutaminase-like domain-containing protein [Pseudomonadales bacterium]MDP6470584.1 transglutaminase-like domain-containing protein [Pseudomonadales bacterium]MDP6828561.1 transglutaminase-like domain-containing protein [Pseudomonadales bacterium]MDP6971873.1 transglutaminase-like domain-containing protein [Pseudomonadales bacterium]